MKINLNDEIWIGIDVQRKNSREFQRMAITKSRDDFTAFCQYLIDSCPDTSRFCFIHQPTQLVIKFQFAIVTLNLKSKRYPSA